MIKTRLVGLLSHAKKYIVYTVLWQWAALLSQIVAVFSIARLLEDLTGHPDLPGGRETAVILLAVVLVRFFCERMQTRSSYLACVDVKRILRGKDLRKMLRLGASYREQVSSSEVVQVSTEGVEQLETYFGKYLPQLFYSPIGSDNAVSGAVKGLFKGQRHAAGVRALDSHFHCGSAEDCKAAFEQILEHLYRPWRFLSGKSSGADHLKNLSGRPVKSR